MPALGPLPPAEATSPSVAADDPSNDRTLTSRQRRRARNSQTLSSLYHQRRDIQGVSPVADFVVEATSWCA